MQQVHKLLQGGRFEEAERMLDTLLKNLGAPASTRATVAPVPGRNCDPQRAMTVSASVTVDEDCVIGRRLDCDRQCRSALRLYQA
jgi:hypothetical protein